ncbi:MAG: SHOCT domain-containing protein [Candidatus Dormibacter sp.]
MDEAQGRAARRQVGWSARAIHLAREVALLPLGEVREVSIRKHWVGSPTIVVEAAGGRAFFPVYVNAARIRAEIAAMVATVRPAAPEEAGSRGPDGDRLERLRRVGELRASGVLSEGEFEPEKARILREP